MTEATQTVATGEVPGADDDEIIRRAQRNLLRLRAGRHDMAMPPSLGASLPIAPQGVSKGDSKVDIQAMADRLRQAVSCTTASEDVRRARVALPFDRGALASKARRLGVPNDPGVLAVATAQEEPAGEAVGLVMGLLRLREKVSRADWDAAHPGLAPVDELIPPTAGLLVFITGDVDTGKTAAGARAVASHLRSALYVRADALPPSDETLRGVSFDRQEEVSQRRLRMLEADLVVIDEVGTEVDPVQVMAWAVLRWPLKATILLGNASVDPKRFWERYNDRRFMSRLMTRQDPRILGTLGGGRMLRVGRPMSQLPRP